MAAALRDACAIVGIGQTEFSKNSGVSETALAVRAIKNALDDAGLPYGDVDGVVKYTMDSTGEATLVSNLGWENLRYYGQIGYGGSGQAAVLGHAAMAIVTGMADVVVCYRALNERSGVRLGQAQSGAQVAGVYSFTDPFGMLSPAHRFGMFARRHMLQYGTTSEHFGHVAVTTREHAQRNPNAMMYGKPMTLEDHQASRLIADPLRLFDCCLESDGGVAVVITSAERAKDLRHPPVYITGSAQGTGPEPDGIVFRPDLGVSEAVYTARELYRQAGVGPEDVDVALIYDHFTPMVLYALESYGFCKPGESGPFVAEGNIRWPNGSLPVNTHGGHLSEAYMHGMGHVLEAVRQLRGSSTAQVEGAEVALVGGATASMSSAAILRK